MRIKKKDFPPLDKLFSELGLDFAKYSILEILFDVSKIIDNIGIDTFMEYSKEFNETKDLIDFINDYYSE